MHMAERVLAGSRAQPDDLIDGSVQVSNHAWQTIVASDCCEGPVKVLLDVDTSMCGQPVFCVRLL